MTPNASRTSALPQEPDAARLPCLATFSPTPAATKAVAVTKPKPITKPAASGGHGGVVMVLPVECTLPAIEAMKTVEGASVGAGTVTNEDELAAALEDPALVAFWSLGCGVHGDKRRDALGVFEHKAKRDHPPHRVSE